MSASMPDPIFTLIPDAATLRAEIARACADAPRWAGLHAVAVVDTTGSTNSDLLEFARLASGRGEPLPERMLRLARSQSAGRGRLARAWQTPRDASLALSIGLRTRLAPAALGGFTLVCGLAVRAALADFAVDARLKWPNDLLDARHGAKLAGILVEVAPADGGSTRGGSTWIVAGVGINLRGGAALGSLLGRGVTDLEALGARGVDPNLLAARVVAQLEARFAEFERAGFAPFRAEFDRVHAYHGRAVVLAGPSGTPLHGVFTGVGTQGEVLLRRADGVVEALINGELSLAAGGA